MKVGLFWPFVEFSVCAFKLLPHTMWGKPDSELGLGASLFIMQFITNTVLTPICLLVDIIYRILNER